MNKKMILMLLLASCFSLAASAQQFAIKTNMLYWATGTLNVGGEYAISKHSTVSLTVNCNPWVFGDDGKLQAWFIQPEYRYWFSEKYTRAFIGVNYLVGQCEVGGFRVPYGIINRLEKNYYKGNVRALGISIGYDFYISPRFSLELMAGAGVARMSYYGEPTKGPKITSPKRVVRYVPSPTEVGVSFVYLFNSRK